MTHEDTAAALAAAMRARVRDVEAGDAFLDAVASRARQPRHGTLTVLGAAAAALVVVGGGVAVGRVAEPPRDAVPATSAPPAPTPRPTEAAKPPRVVATRVPSGWDRRPYSVTSSRMQTRGEGVVYVEAVVYRRTVPTDRPTEVRITTTSGDVPAVEAAVAVTSMRYDGTIRTEHEEPIRIGDRMVYPFPHDHRGPGAGFYTFRWTEAPGVNVSVFAMGVVSEAEARAFVRNSRVAGS